MLVVTYAYNMILFAIFTVSKIVSGFLSLFQILLDLSSGKTFQEELKQAAKKPDATATSILQAGFKALVAVWYRDTPEV